MTIEELNNLPKEEVAVEFKKCCGSDSWVDKMCAGLPYSDRETLLSFAETAWGECDEDAILEAFKAHPKIGDASSLAKKYANTQQWANNEQSGVQAATTEVLERLANKNDEYEQKFTYIFIVCATGKSAKEMLDLLEKRLPNDPETELKVAAAEQNKITLIRLEKLLS